MAYSRNPPKPVFMRNPIQEGKYLKPSTLLVMMPLSYREKVLNRQFYLFIRKKWCFTKLVIYGEKRHTKPKIRSLNDTAARMKASGNRGPW